MPLSFNYLNAGGFLDLDKILGRHLWFQIWLIRIWNIFSISINISGKYDAISAGYGDNVWAIGANGDLLRHEQEVSQMPPLSGWVKVIGLSLKMIQAGNGGVFGLDENGIFLSLKGEVIDDFSVNFLIVWFLILEVEKKGHAN